MLAGIWVQAQDINDVYNTRSVYTDEAGRYTFTGLFDVAHYVEVLAIDYPYQAYTLATSRAMAESVSINETHIDFVLSTGSNIHGRVTNNKNVMLNNVMIYAISDSTDVYASTSTNEAGQYTLTNLPFATDYVVYADSGDYPIQYFDTVDNRNDAQFVDLTYGTVKNVNIVLNKGPIIRGNVRINDSTTSAGQGIMVNIFSDSTQTGGTVSTDANGVFELGGLNANATDYIISIWEPDYLPAFYKSSVANTTVYVMADAEEIAPSDVYRNIVLKKGHTVCGHVSTIDSSVVESFSVEFWSSATNGYAFTQVTDNTAAEANYCVKNVLSGTYEAMIQADGYADQTGNVTVSGNRSDVDFVLDLPSRAIGGTVYNLGSGKQVQISACSDSLMIGKCKSVSVSGNGDIGYTINGLKPATDYVVELWSASYPDQVYDGQTQLSNATKVNVKSTNQSGIDFTMPEVVPEISGTVTFPDTGAVSGDSVAVQAFSDNGTSGSTTVTFNAAKVVTYRITGLSAVTDYKVLVWSSKYKTQYFDNVFTESDAALVNTADDQTDNAINFILTTGRQITGQVFQSNGTPVGAGVYVEAQSIGNVNAWSGTTTESDGTYLIGGLDARSDYIVSAKKTDIPKAYYNSAGSVQTKSLAEKVNLIDDDAESKDITIQTGFSIQGTVRDTLGKSIFGVWVSASSETKDVGSGVYSAIDGSFKIKGLPDANDYVVKAIPQSGQTYIKQTKTGITAGATGLNFILETGFTLAGSVMAETTGIPITRADVLLSSTDNDYFYKGGLDVDGQFEIGGLLAGSDYVLTIKPDASISYVKKTEKFSINANQLNKLIFLARSVQIQGSVQLADGSPVNNAWVSVFSLNRNTSANDWTDTNGAFAITNIPDATDYVLTVSHADYPEKQKNVSIGENIVITLVNGGRITGQARSESGPLPNVFVELWSESLPLFKNVMTDANGNFVFTGVPLTKNGFTVSDYEITVDGDTVGYPDKTKKGLKAGDSVIITLERTLENEIKGTVSDDDGTLMPAGENVTVYVYTETWDYVKAVAVASDGTAAFNITGLQAGEKYYLAFYYAADGTMEYDLYRTAQNIPFKFSKELW
ncbi:MAG: hypothetical protein OMM_03165 [Candidatus Magnetoglobus multicellularis str. Araruama]|uniref:Uncharacterized protein n=1 Tax=Candidatus Magnetoglobus multicellularis str. Araruama TaxID=890399 RepID=A0A1V1P6M0_9BACT|nr:MAG: hypothetical protein OMM_03165 [Candidatus Magnetoglobus multicellularis str. Araruama]